MQTRRSVSVNWVYCGTCYTKSQDTELGGIEGAESGFSRSNAEKKKAGKGKKGSESNMYSC